MAQRSRIWQMLEETTQHLMNKFGERKVVKK